MPVAVNNKSNFFDTLKQENFSMREVKTGKGNLTEELMEFGK